MPDAVATMPCLQGVKPAVETRGSDVFSAYQEYLQDESRLGGGHAEKILFPEREEQVCMVMAQANATGEPVTVSGGRSGIVGGAVPFGGTLMSMERMNRIVGLRNDGDGYIVRLQPGVSVKALGSALEGRLDNCLPPGGEGEFLESFRMGRFFYPVDPTEDTAQIGGTVSTNASGGRSLLYGVTRQYVESLRVVLPTGEVLSVARGQCRAKHGVFGLVKNGERTLIPVPLCPRPSVKNCAGYYSGPGMDLIDLFIGAEGTLGIITEVELRLAPKPYGIFTGLAFFLSERDAVGFVRRARADFTGYQRPQSVMPMSLEYFDSRSLRLLEEYALEVPHAGYPAFPSGSEAAVLFEQGYSEEDLEPLYEGWEGVVEASGSDMGVVWGGFDESSAEPVKKVRHALPEVVNTHVARNRLKCPSLHKIGTDMAVGDQHLEDLMGLYGDTLRSSGISYVLFGHIGQNHLHANLLPRSVQEMERAEGLVHHMALRVMAMGGSPLVEHGGGRLKRSYIPMIYGRQGLDEMAAIKKALDPGNILNRGVLLDLEESDGNG